VGSAPPSVLQDILFLQDFVWNFQGKVEKSKSTFVLRFRYSLYHWRGLITCPLFSFPSLFLPSTSSNRSPLLDLPFVRIAHRRLCFSFFSCPSAVLSVSLFSPPLPTLFLAVSPLYRAPFLNIFFLNSFYFILQPSRVPSLLPTPPPPSSHPQSPVLW